MRPHTGHFLWPSELGGPRLHLVEVPEEDPPEGWQPEVIDFLPAARGGAGVRRAGSCHGQALGMPHPCQGRPSASGHHAGMAGSQSETEPGRRGRRQAWAREGPSLAASSAPSPARVPSASPWVGSTGRPLGGVGGGSADLPGRELFICRAGQAAGRAGYGQGEARASTPPS